MTIYYLEKMLKLVVLWLLTNKLIRTESELILFKGLGKHCYSV